MATKSRSILIAGAGISGLTAALGLAGAGFRVEVFEQAAKLETIGAGLQISPNALSVLDELGLTRRLMPLAVAPSAIRVMSARSGREIASVPLGETAARRYGLPYLVLHRADLLQSLASACADNPDITIRYGQSLEDFASHPNGVTGLIRRGAHMEELGGIAVVAADGVWSRLRQRHFRQPPAVYSGYTAWRAIIPANRLTGSQDLESTQLWLSPNAHAVTYPLRAGRALNIVVVVRTESNARTWSEPGLTTELAEVLKGWHRSFRGLIDPHSSWTTWPLFAMPSTQRLVVGNAALIGDAAHAMLPFAAQGAAMGIEDAAVLSAKLAPALHGGVEVDEALHAYEAQRLARTRSAARLAQANRWIYHLPFPLSLARNLTMTIAGGPRLLSRQDWLYSWKPEAA